MLSTYQHARLAQLAAASVAVLGTLLNWATVLFVSVNGLDTDWGKLAAGLAVLGAAVVLIARLPWPIQLLMPSLVLLTCVWWIVHLSGLHSSGALQIHVDTGSGTYVTMIASVAWLVLVILGRNLADTPEAAAA
jgi:hypothetical protein